jgi:hypothetical protein
MTTMKSKFFLPLAATLVGMFSLVPTPGAASTIFWGSFEPDYFYTSNGTPLGSSFLFEVGTFDTTGGWTPSSTNVTEWSGRWKVFDRATDGAGWDTVLRKIENSVDHTATSGSSSPDALPTDVFAQGSTAYLWVYNSLNIQNAATEWALLADMNRGVANNLLNDWVFPDPALQSGESFDWQTRDLDTAIFGGVNNIQGPGDYTSTPAMFTIQTHVVPEPGGALLIAAAGVLVVLRRRPRI